MAETETKSFAARMAETYRGSQSVSDFMKELKALTHEDKVWFAEQFNKEGLPTSPPMKQAAA